MEDRNQRKNNLKEFDSSEGVPMLLVVDDEELIVELIIEELSDFNVRILTASNGKAGLEQFYKEVPDAVLSDINMPEMKGLTFLKEIRRLGFDTPFVFLTGYGDRGMVIEALRLGAFDFLDKPFNSDLLRDVLGKAIQLGIKLKKISKEIVEITRKENLTKEQSEHLAQLKKAILIVKSDPPQQVNHLAGVPQDKKKGA